MASVPGSCRFPVSRATNPAMNARDPFLELVRTHGPRLQRLASAYARGADRQDLLQEIWLQVWRSLPNYRGDAALATWAYRIALNTALTHVRVEIRRRDAVAAAAQQATESEAVPGGGGEELRVLQEFMAALGEVDRAVMLLYLEGLSHEQMAELLGRSAGAIGVRISRLKAVFKQRWLGR